MLLWETMNNYSGHKELFSVGSSLINEAKNITSLNDTVLNSIFIFRQLTEHNIDYLY